MLQIAAPMMISSGAIHAVVNAVLKSGDDKLAGRALIDLSGGLLVLPAIFFFPPPHGAWGWLLGSLIVHAVYFLALVRAFEVADMSGTYPVMRGTAPVFAAFGAVVFLGDAITLPGAIGMGLVTSGILLSAIGRNLTQEALGYSLLTASRWQPTPCSTRAASGTCPRPSPTSPGRFSCWEQSSAEPSGHGAGAPSSDTRIATGKSVSRPERQASSAMVWQCWPIRSENCRA
jgi:multidrug transporter EmrE-like cation transporter